MSSFVIHVPTGGDVSSYVYKALSTKDVKKRKINANEEPGAAVDVSSTEAGSIVVSMREHILSIHGGDVARVVKYELRPRLRYT
jgi:hypothetical protein